MGIWNCVQSKLWALPSIVEEIMQRDFLRLKLTRVVRTTLLDRVMTKDHSSSARVLTVPAKPKELTGKWNEKHLY